MGVWSSIIIYTVYNIQVPYIIHDKFRRRSPVWKPHFGQSNIIYFILGLHSFNDILRHHIIRIQFIELLERFSLNWWLPQFSAASFSWSFCIVCVSSLDAWKLLRAISTACSLLLSNQISFNICWCWILLRFAVPILSRLRKFLGFFFTSA